MKHNMGSARFPGGRKKALTFGFDDGEIYDRRLADLFRKYGMKATFFLITDGFGSRVPFHRYGKDTVVERVSREELAATYAGMETASHTASHHDCTAMDFEMLKREIERSYTALGFQYDSSRKPGMAYPGGVYNADCIEFLKRLSVPYARTAFDTHTFSVPEGREAFLVWNPTCRYNDPEIGRIIERFLEVDCESQDCDRPGCCSSDCDCSDCDCSDCDSQNCCSPDCDSPVCNSLSLLYIRGHSYELEAPDPGSGWDALEEQLKKLSFRDDIWYATNIELYREVSGWTSI